MTETRILSATTVGRYLLEPGTKASFPLLVGFHGYGQNAETLLRELRRIPGATTCNLVSVQALHRFYNTKSQEVVGSWMTSLDRKQAIEDNVAYVNQVIAALHAEVGGGKLVFVGFSQGAAMAWRAAARCGPCEGVIVLGGDLPQDVIEAPDLCLPPALIGRGERDSWYTAEKLASDLAVLEKRGCHAEAIRFDGGHEWGQAFLEAAGRFLEPILGQ